MRRWEVPIGNQSIAEDTPWTFQVPASAFDDVDSTLTYSATLAMERRCRAWLTFDAATRTFSGTPPQDFTGSLDLTVTANDGFFALSDTFTLTVTPVERRPRCCPDPEPDLAGDASGRSRFPPARSRISTARSDLHGDSVGWVGFARVAFFRHDHWYIFRYAASGLDGTLDLR